MQNKLLYAVTGRTAAEVAGQRADADSPNMALTSWKGARVRKQDVTIAKNYLSSEEIDTLNRLVVIFLEQAELRARERKDLTLDYWRTNVDRQQAFNERPVLLSAGSVSAKKAEQVAHERYEQFDAQRRRGEALGVGHRGHQLAVFDGFERLYPHGVHAALVELASIAGAFTFHAVTLSEHDFNF